jgi:hypothetical protein
VSAGFQSTRLPTKKDKPGAKSNPESGGIR